MSWLRALVARPPAAQYYTALTFADRPVLFSHDDLTAYRLEGGRWTRLAGGRPASFYSQPWSVNATLGEDALWVLADELWCARGTGALELVAALTPKGPGAHFAHRTAMVWDVRVHRLLVIGGEGSGDVWAFEDGAWRALPAGPPRGYACAVSTLEGVYVVSGRELWLLRDESWTCLAREPSWPAGQKRARGAAHALFCHRGTLLAAGATKDDDATELAALASGDSGWRSLARFPELEALAGGYLMRGWYPATVMLDPAGDRILLLVRGEHGGPIEIFATDLVDRSAAAPPTVPLASAARPRARASSRRTRRAWAIRPLDEAAPVPSFAVPSGWRVAALFPADSDTLALPGHAGLAVLLKEPYPSESRLMLLPAGQTPEAAIHPFGESARRVSLTAFDEVDPRVADEHTLDAGEGDAQSSKLGGYPMEGDSAEPCSTCGRPLTLAVRLAADLFPELGDGAVEVYLCPEGHPSFHVYLC